MLLLYDDEADASIRGTGRKLLIRRYWNGPIFSTLEHFPYYRELLKFNEVQLFLTEKLREHRRFGLHP